MSIRLAVADARHDRFRKALIGLDGNLSLPQARYRPKHDTRCAAPWFQKQDGPPERAVLSSIRVTGRPDYLLGVALARLARHSRNSRYSGSRGSCGASAAAGAAAAGGGAAP